MTAVGVSNTCFTLPRECCKDGTRRSAALDAFQGIVDRLLAEAPDRVMLEIGGGRFILRVLKATHALQGALAPGSSTLKEVTEAIIVVLNEDVLLEESIYRRTPGELELICYDYNQLLVI